MLTLYLVSSIVAGVLILLSIFGAGDHEFSHDGDVDLNIDHDADTDTDHDSDHGAVGTWIPFFSLRFYTYFFAGLGATGLMLTYLTTASQSLTLILSLVTAMVCGLSVWLTIKLVRRSETSSAATEQDLLGKEGTVLVAIHGRNPGRIRCTVRGDIIDYLAYSEDETPIHPGDTVVVLALENGRAQVMAREAVFGEALPTRTS